MNLQISKIQTQRLLFTASLGQSITVLLLPHAELLTSIEQELQSNPLLEAEQDSSTIQEKKESSTYEDDRIEALLNLPADNVTDFLGNEEETQPPSMTSTITLEDHLYQQLYWEVSDPLRRKIGEFIIGNLDNDGFLTLSCQEIANALQIADVTVINEVLSIIQSFDPPGIAAKDIKECLVIQIRSRKSPHNTLAIEIVEKYLDQLSHKKYAALSKTLSTPVETIKKAVELITSLEPKPTRNFRPINPSIYVQPDLYVRKEQDKYIIETNKSGLPLLRINQTYKNLLKKQNISEKERSFIKEKLTSAINFIKSVQLRGETLTLIAGYILEHQKRFFDGDDPVIMPMSLKDLALHLDRAESTISRAVSHKYIDTPRGLYPLKFFFSHSVSNKDNENISVHTVKEQIAQLIADEDKKSPLSDQQIQNYFQTKGLRLARRTVAKYRQMLNIPPSHLRK